MKHFNGHRLRKARLARGWGIPELVYQVRHRFGIAISERAVRAHEGGTAPNPGAQTIAAYAAALGVEPGAFFTGRTR
jgi:transcriptional regulator with XRE-family HTH domain